MVCYVTENVPLHRTNTTPINHSNCHSLVYVTKSTRHLYSYGDISMYRVENLQITVAVV